jgi:hypothetical protein
MIRVHNPRVRDPLLALVSAALLPTSSMAGAYDVGAIRMYICDSGEDLCGNTLKTPVIYLPSGQFAEDIVFSLWNPLPYDPIDNTPLLSAVVYAIYPNSSDLNITSIALHESTGVLLGAVGGRHGLPDAYPGWNTVDEVGALIYRASGDYLEIKGVASGGGVALGVSLSAFDLGPLDTTPAMPEPPTWAMLGIGFAGLAFAASVRDAPTRRAQVDPQN